MTTGLAAGRTPATRNAWMALWYGGWVIAGIALILFATPWGIGIRYDSMSYLTAAQSLARGDCLCRIGSGLELKPLVHFGPLYPVLLWIGTVVSGDLLTGARWITAALYGVNLAAWGALVHVHTRRFWAGAIVTALLAVSPVLLQVHDAAMSEPLFLAILAVALFGLTVYLASGKRGALWLAAGAVAAAVLTRYAAGFLMGLALLSILLLRNTSWRERLADGLRFAVGAGTPVAIWLIRNLVETGSATNRTVRWHPMTIDDLRAFLQVVTGWFTSGVYSHWVEGGILAAVLAGLGVWLSRHLRTKEGEPDAAAILGLLLVGLNAIHPAYIALSRSVFDDSIPIDDRMFSPMLIAWVALIGVVAAIVSRRRRAAWILLPAAAILLIGPVPHMIQGYRAKVEGMRADGIQFASRSWRDSESIAWVRSLPQDAVVYSNRAVILQFLTGRAVYQIPEAFDTVKAEARADFLDQLDLMYADLQRPGSYLLIFDAAQPVTVDDLQDEYRIGMKVLRTTADGFIMVSDSAERTP